MQQFETIEIKFSMTKTALMVLGCLAFVVIGICFVLSPHTFLSPVAHSTTTIFLAGCAGILLFSIFGFTHLMKLIKDRPALIISTEGILDNSSGVSAGFIPWSDIIALKEQVVAKQRFLNLIVKDPQAYIDRQKSAFKRKIMQKNHDIFKTDIGISTNSLKVSHDELKSLLQEKILEMKK